METLPPLMNFCLYVAVSPSHSNNATGAILQHHLVFILFCLAFLPPRENATTLCILQKNKFGLYLKKETAETIWLKAIYVNSCILSYLLSWSH